MGPTIIFDKSFLQSLNPDEAVWLDMFFYANITPLFFVETLADLKKEIKKGRTPEQVVGNLAYKTPDMYVVPNAHHRTLMQGELLGTSAVDMRFGRPIRAAGRDTRVDGQKGVVFEQSPEEEALGRWQRKEFSGLERNHANAWRHALSLISPNDQQSMFPGWFGDKKPSELATVKAAADSFIDGKNKRSALTFGLTLLDVHPDAQAQVVQRWKAADTPDLSEFAPYFRHVYGIELFFHLARSADLVSQRRTNKVDIAYLYYLPFCMVFTSNDKLHSKTVPLFLRSHQSFVWGPELKADLSRVDQHYSALPEEVKDRGLHHFASQPPSDPSFLVTQLWDRYMRPDWRKLNATTGQDRDRTANAELIAKIRRAAEAAQTNPTAPERESDSLDYVITKHYVSKKKGKWKRFPPEVEKAEDDSHE